jgi:hypothetical protein
VGMVVQTTRPHWLCGNKIGDKDMGQYYLPIILSDDGKPNQWFSSHEYGNGLKLMEHSWLENDLVAAVEALLVLDGARRIVWAGDYADSEPGGDTLFNMCAGDPVRFDCKALNSASYLEPVKPNAGKPIEVSTTSHPFIVNMDKHEYVDKREVPASRWGIIHPLPLLTCEGNGRGGGDYRGDWQHVGRWARDHIAVTTQAERFGKLDVTGLVE